MPPEQPNAPRSAQPAPPTLAGDDARPGHLVVHACHHKTGTVWFTDIFRAISREFGLALHDGPQDGLAPGVDLFVDNKARLDPGALPPHRGTHMIRDPRDVIVSGYFYHLHSQESWLHEPRPHLDGRTYQQHLLSLDREDGLIAAARMGSALAIADMVAWDYGRPEFLELRYEDVITDYEAWFDRIFSHYGFRGDDHAACMRIAERSRFENREKRALGEVRENRHRRSGKPGQWRDVFTPRVADAVRALHGPALVALGYESGDDW